MTQQNEKAIPVFLSSDDNYAPYMSALMASIVNNTKAKIDFYIIDAGISDFNKKRIKSMLCLSMGGRVYKGTGL